MPEDDGEMTLGRTYHDPKAVSSMEKLRIAVARERVHRPPR